jgi:hypothetical protein
VKYTFFIDGKEIWNLSLPREKFSSPLQYGLDGSRGKMTNNLLVMINSPQFPSTGETNLSFIASSTKRFEIFPGHDEKPTFPWIGKF